MQPKRFDLVICDIDGCLSPEDTAGIDLASLSWIAAYNARAHASGLLPSVTLCSGRPQPFAEAMCRMIDVRGVPCVCENGAWLYERHTNRYELDPSITAEHIAALRALSDWVASEYGSARGDLGHTVGVTQQPGKAASVSLYHPNTAYLKGLMPAIEREVETRGWPIRVSATWFYINLDLRHVSKGSGLDRLLAIARGGGGIGGAVMSDGEAGGDRVEADSIKGAARYSRDRLIGIGDTTSDMPIRERCGFFACPRNAQAEIRRHADFVSEHDEVAGVIDILRRIESGTIG